MLPVCVRRAINTVYKNVGKAYVYMSAMKVRETIGTKNS